MFREGEYRGLPVETVPESKSGKFYPQPLRHQAAGQRLVVAPRRHNGDGEGAYSDVGLVKSTIDKVLTPMKASALYVGMRFAKPLALFEAMGVSAERLADFSKTFMNSLAAPLGSRV